MALAAGVVLRIKHNQGKCSWVSLVVLADGMMNKQTQTFNF